MLKPRYAALLFVSGALIVTHCASAVTAVIYVDQTATGANDGSSWVNARTNLQAALSDANCLLGNSISCTPLYDEVEIRVADGVYKPTSGSNRAIAFEIPVGVILKGGYPVGGGSDSDRAVFPSNTILSGDIGTPSDDTDNSYQVVRLTSSVQGERITIDGFQVAYANSTSGVPMEPGGGIASSGVQGANNVIVSINILSCWIHNNKAALGAGLRLGGPQIGEPGNITVVVDSTSFTNNMAVSTTSSVAPIGGAFWLNCFGSHIKAKCRYFESADYNCNVVENNATRGGSGAGGVVFGPVVVDGYVFRHNNIFEVDTCSGGELSVAGLYLNNTDSNGGIVNCQFYDNGTAEMSSVPGVGALHLGTYSITIGDRAFRVINSVVAKNRAYLAPAAYCPFKAGSSWFNCTVMDNAVVEAECAGGEDDQPASIVFASTSGYSGPCVGSETRNCADQTDILPMNVAWFVNCVLWDPIPLRTRKSGAVQQIGRDKVIRVHRCILRSTAPLSGSSWPVCDNDSNIVADPLLDVGYFPTASSPCRDAGDTSILLSDFGDLDRDGILCEPCPNDLRYSTRVMFSEIDIGAYEWRCPADVANSSGDGGADGVIDEGDYNFFINSFFGSKGFCESRLADIADDQGNVEWQNDVNNYLFTEGDYNAFFNYFFIACP